MNGYVVVDASVWVARLVAGDIFHEASRNWLEGRRTKEDRFLAPSLLLAEVAGAIAHRTGEANLASRAITILKQLENLRLVEMEAELSGQAADLATTLGLRGADAFYVAVAARLSVPLATLDTDQQRRAADVVEIWEVDLQ